MNNAMYDAIKPFAKLAFALYAPITAKGVANIPQTGPAIIASNHVSGVDPFVIYVTCPRRTVFLAKEDLFETPGIPWLADKMGVIRVDRRNPDLSTAKAALRALREGMPVMIAPEGTRSLTGKLLPFKAGFVKLAEKSRAPIIPTAVIGSYELWPRQRKLPRPGRITIVYDEPVQVSDFVQGKRMNDETLERVSGLVWNRIALMIEAHGGH